VTAIDGVVEISSSWGPSVADFHSGPRDTVCPSHIRAALLAGRPEVQVILMEQPQQLPRTG
jgi:hypothetical protein